MKIKQAMIAAAMIGCGLAAPAFADGHGGSCVSVGFASHEPGMQIAFRLNSGDGYGCGERPDYRRRDNRWDHGGWRHKNNHKPRHHGRWW